MTKYNKKIENELTEKINNLLKSNDIKSEEKKILFSFISNKNDSFLKKVQDLKNSLRNLQIENSLEDGLSEEVLNLYTHIQKIVPNSGPSSIFNGLIK